MGDGLCHLAVGGDEVDDVAHDAEQRDHEGCVHAGDDLGPEQRHEDPHARDADEQPPARRLARPAGGEQYRVAQLHRAHRQHAHEHEDPDERAGCRALLAEDIEAAHHVVGQTLPKADLAHQVGEHEREGEGDGDGQAAELAASVEGDDTAAHELGETRDHAREDRGDVRPGKALVLRHALEQRDLLCDGCPLGSPCTLAAAINCARSAPRRGDIARRRLDFLGRLARCSLLLADVAHVDLPPRGSCRGAPAGAPGSVVGSAYPLPSLKSP